MAMYHLRAKIHSRAAGKSAVACAAYRAGERLKDERFGVTQDYTKKRGVIESGIEAPEGAAAWATNRGRLWNEVEKSETRKNSRLAREFEVSLPHELTKEQRTALVRDFCQTELVRRGMVADWSVHEPNSRGDKRAFHVHIMTTTREIGAEGFTKKARDWDRRDTLCDIREAWARHANQALERAGLEARIDHRTLAAQGIDRDPVITKGVKLTNMERSERWKDAAAEIIESMKQERGREQRERKALKQEIRWKGYEGQALELAAAAVDDPAQTRKAQEYISQVRDKIVAEMAADLEPSYQKALAKAEKTSTEASRKRTAWEKSHPIPSPDKRLLESHEKYIQRFDRERVKWNRSREPFLKGEDEANKAVQTLTQEKAPRQVAWQKFMDEDRFRIFSDIQTTLSEIPKDLSRTNERRRDDRDLGR